MTETELKPTFTRGETIVGVPVNGKYANFVFPEAGPDTYRNVFQNIQKRNLRPATGEETANLLHVAYLDSPNEPESKIIKDIMRQRWLWVANRNLWTPEGVYVVYDKNCVGRSQDLDIKNLEKCLSDAKEIDGVKFGEGVNFAPRKSFGKGDYVLSSEDFAQDGYIRASYGQDGAKKLAEVSKEFSSKPRIWTLNVSKPEQRFSALYVYDGRLGAFGYDFYGSGGSYSFGVRD